MTPTRFPVGTMFRTGGKHPRLCRVVDIHETRNLKGEIVRVRYVATHEFCGQPVTDSDVTYVTIAKGRVQ